jgi:NAD+ synthase
MPEKDSAPDTLTLSEQVSLHFGCRRIVEDISGVLESVGHYRRYHEAAKKVVPEYGKGWKSKLEVSKLDNDRGLTYFNFVAQSPANRMIKECLPLKAYLEIVAASNFKQRTRKMLEYYYADRLNYAVCGTPNRLEYDQGFFVKQGDGAADIKPIAHLYKSQVYQIAEYVGVPPEIIDRPPTTDTYSLDQGQDEFYFAVSYDKMDLCLFGKNNGMAIADTAAATGLSVEQVGNIYTDIDKKRSTTRYLHLPALLVKDIPQIKVE